jgi:C-terminal peptidase prc
MESKGLYFMFRPRLTGLLGVAVALLPLLHRPVLGAAEAQPSQPRVVLIGISQYADKQIKPRPHAEDDTRALYDLFTDKQYLGADPKNVRLLLGKPDDKRHSRPATRKNILAALEWLAANARPDDLTLFVFIGEGGPLGAKSDRRCYFASDSTFKDRNKTAVAAADIAERLQKLKSRRFCAFVDVDFKGFVDPKIASPTLGASPYREFLGDDKTDEHNPLPGRVVYLATNGLSVSLDLKEHGLFTTALLSGLKGAADKEGYEPDGVVTVGELTDYLKTEMADLAAKHGKTEEQKEQLHYVLGDRQGATPITTNPAVQAKVRQRLEKLAELVADKKLPEKFADEGKRLLGQMPRLKSQQELRKQYQQLVDGSLTAEKFEAKRTEILDSIKLAPEVAEKFAQKVLEASKMLGEAFVRKVERGDLVAAAIRGLYRAVKEKVPETLSERLTKAKKLKGPALKTLLVDARVHLGKREDLDKHKDIDLALRSMTRDLKDPYSTYIDPETLEQFTKSTSGQFVGIGVQIRKDRATDSLLVVTPIMGSPAYRAGIRADDHITAITLLVDAKGKPLDKPEVISTKGLDTGEAVRRISGKAGTEVKITVQRQGEDKPRNFLIKRQKIEVETVLGYQRKAGDSWDFMIDPKTKIGYIRLTQFNKPSALDMLRAVKELKAQGLRGLVLDLRFNPGGLLGSAKDIADLFIDDGLIVSIRPRGEPEDKMLGESEGSELRFPMAVLVNGGSASGSEIVAACLQDHARAVIIGERSYGKGSVQNVVPFAGGQMKVTTASFWPPSGRNLNKGSTKGRDEDVWGVKPNKGYELKLSLKETDDLEEHLRESEIILAKGAPRKRTNPEFKDRQLELALKYLRQQVKLAERADIKKAG